MCQIKKAMYRLELLEKKYITQSDIAKGFAMGLPKAKEIFLQVQKETYDEGLILPEGKILYDRFLKKVGITKKQLIEDVELLQKAQALEKV